MSNDVNRTTGQNLVNAGVKGVGDVASNGAGGAMVGGIIGGIFGGPVGVAAGVALGGFIGSIVGGTQATTRIADVCTGGNGDIDN